MTKVPRKTRVQIGAKVGVDERVVLAVFDGKAARYEAVTKQIVTELKKHGFTPKPQDSAAVPAEADPTPAPGTGEG